MDILKIPRIEKEEYDRLIKENFICRIAFRGELFPYIAPFLYIFDGKHLYFLPTRYGRKINYFKKDPSVSVEIENFSSDLSQYRFVSLQGILEEITDLNKKQQVKSDFTAMIKQKSLSSNIMAVLGYAPGDSLEIIIREDRNLVWKLINVQDIIALKNP